MRSGACIAPHRTLKADGSTPVVQHIFPSLALDCLTSTSCYIASQELANAKA